MAGPASSSMFTRLTNAYRLLSLRSDIDNIILELLGQFSLEKIYCDSDKDTYQNLVITLLAQLNTIFNVQRLSLPSENQQVGWYLGFLASWEVTLRSIEFVLQVVVEGRESLWEARLLRDKYLPELLLNALRVLTLHPKIPSNQKAKDRRDRFARVHRSLERVFDSYPSPESFLLLICKEVTDSLRTEPNGLALPPRMRSDLPSLATELYPLPECLSSQYVANIVPQDGFPGNWLAQLMALRDVSHFVVGASVQYAVNRETRDMRLQSSSARTRNAVLHALENIRIPSHLSKVDLIANFSDTFRIILPDTLSLTRRGSSEGLVDEHDIDAIDELCSRLSDRQIVNRVSDREVMHSVAEVTRRVELLDDPTGKFRAARPKVFVLNCEACHVVGESQLKDSDRVMYTPSSRDTAEIVLPPKSKCLACGEEITMMRELNFARDSWELLKPLESNADTINVERHLPTQFQMTSPKIETGLPFHPGYGNILREGRRNSCEPESSSSPPTHIQIPDPRFVDRSRPTANTFLMSPNSPGLGKRLEVQRADLTPSEELTSSDGANYFDTTPGTSDPPQKSPSNVGDVIAPLSPSISPPALGSQSRLHSISTVSFEPERLQKSRSTSSAPPPEKSKSRWRSKLTSSKKESSKTSGDSSSLSSTTLESQKLEEISLKNLVSSSKISRGKSGKNINVAISQNSSYVLFWTQASINIWDVGASSPLLGRAVLTESNCVLAAVTKVHLAYIIGTRDQKLTLRIVDLIQPSVPMIEYRMPSSPWCHSICIDPKENHVAVGFDNCTVRFFNAGKSEEPREERLHSRNHRDCRQCPPIDTLSFSSDGLVLIASTRSPKNGTIQIYAWRFPFEESQELTTCRYQVPLHESEDNGVSSAIFRSGVCGEENLVCISTWTQSGVPVLVQPQGGHRSEIRSDSSTHQGKLGNRIQCAAFSPTGGELAIVNDKGHLYHISNLNASPMEVKRIATSKELTTRSDAFAMTFMKLPDEEAIVMAWADSSKAVGFVKKVPVRYSVSQYIHGCVIEFVSN
ncbi:hypothetical protein ONS95_004186 [Cadophora gregata]|uniref:uncharacterized protein n=1 Tax=Cadophora gregata TaxID=51156 RepID=UPI0026DC66B5|nr:uncharacterized protein ONS95_004186 [Cadophora gregata]KAK0105447.1 hypothetical protein ONS96_004834 [Cadophora gregata f. sp. sojae]KAK0105659.1 hypothetical protein ONS95_004186 [Cadophora gregata]